MTTVPSTPHQEGVLASSASRKPNTSDISETMYALLRRLAASMLEHERPGHTLQPTALVHEAYLRLGGSFGADAEPGTGGAEDVGRWALAIRRVLVDHHRRRIAAKRGGPGARRVDVDSAAADDAESVLPVEEALVRLEGINPEMAQVVTLRFYGGLSVEQIAGLRKESVRTVARTWAFARAWLGRELAS